MLLWPFIKETEIKKLTANALETQVLYMSGLFFFLLYWLIAYILSILVDIDLRILMPYGILGSALFGCVFVDGYKRNNSRKTKTRL